jgi:GAF domain-containing protein
LGQLAEEQAALRRVAMLVARGEPPEAVFAAVAGEVGRLLRVELATLFRYELGRTATSVTSWGPAGVDLPVGVRWPLEGHNVTTLVFQTGRPARIDRYGDSSSGPLSAAVRETGIRSAVGVPLLVEGSLGGGFRRFDPGATAAAGHRGAAGLVHRTGRRRSRTPTAAPS